MQITSQYQSDRKFRGKWIFSFFLLIICVPCACLAESTIGINDNGDEHTIVFISNDPIEISGYNIQLNYLPSDTQIITLSPNAPYSGDSNIRNDAGWAKIIGFTGGMSGSTNLANFTYSGSNNFSIVVYEIVDMNLKNVHVTNLMAVPPTRPMPTTLPSGYYQSPQNTENVNFEKTGNTQISTLSNSVNELNISDNNQVVLKPEVLSQRTNPLPGENPNSSKLSLIMSEPGSQNRNENYVDVNLSKPIPLTSSIQKSSFSLIPMFGTILCLIILYRKFGKD